MPCASGLGYNFQYYPIRLSLAPSVSSVALNSIAFNSLPALLLPWATSPLLPPWLFVIATFSQNTSAVSLLFHLFNHTVQSLHFIAKPLLFPLALQCCDAVAGLVHPVHPFPFSCPFGSCWIIISFGLDLKNSQWKEKMSDCCPVNSCARACVRRLAATKLHCGTTNMGNKEDMSCCTKALVGHVRVLRRACANGGTAICDSSAGWKYSEVLKIWGILPAPRFISLQLKGMWLEQRAKGHLLVRHWWVGPSPEAWYALSIVSWSCALLILTLCQCAVKWKKVEGLCSVVFCSLLIHSHLHLLLLLRPPPQYSMYHQVLLLLLPHYGEHRVLPFHLRSNSTFYPDSITTGFFSLSFLYLRPPGWQQMQKNRTLFPENERQPPQSQRRLFLEGKQNATLDPSQRISARMWQMGLTMPLIGYISFSKQKERKTSSVCYW